MPNKNVLAILTGVLAIVGLVLSVLSHGHPAAIVGASVAATFAAGWGVTTPSRRTPLIVMSVAAGSAALFFHFDNFWGLVVCGLSFVWAAFGLLPFMDGVWRLKVGFVAAVFLGALVVLWPTLHVMSAGRIPLPAYVHDRVDRAIAKGLDIQGGMRLVYTVEVEEAIRDKRDHFADEMRQKLATLYGIHSGEGRVTRDEYEALDKRVHVSTPEAESAVVRLQFKKPPPDVKWTLAEDMAKIDDTFIKGFASELSMQKGPGEDELTFKIKAEIETQIRDSAVAQAKDTVSRRVDELGLKEAAVTTRDEDIIVEVPGADDKSFAETKDTIKKTARLEFKMVDDAATAKLFHGVDVPTDEGIEIREHVSQPDGLDSDGKKKRVEGAFARIACQPPKYPKETMQECLARFKEWARTLNAPDDHEIGFEAVTEPVEGTEPQQFKQVGWFSEYLFSRTELTGDYITDADIGQDQQNFGQYYVQLSFSPAGADRFEEVTGANVNRRFAIILDGLVDSAPVIKTKIGGGKATITMGAGDPEKQVHDAQQLKLVLRSGALPAPITAGTESHIGASLGSDAIREVLKGGAYGVGLVLAFMIFYYRKSGVLADVAVLFNVLLQLAVLASFDATMTLPGIAGLALTIGMNVDANVLINERIREELRSGKTVRAATDAGYTRAWPSIIDGHMTVFISGLILAQYGSGPVKGFAVTLVVGILCGLFTGVFCTRIVFDWWVRGARVKRLSVGAEF
jgi:preprotein translocase subunit SecD